MSGVAIHVSGETIAVWIVIGIMDNSTEEIPDYMMRTSPERYYKSLEFLESCLFVTKYPDYRIVNLDKLTYAGNLANLRDIEDSPNYVFEKGDILSLIHILLKLTDETRH